MAAPGARTLPPTGGQKSMPPLENGDRLTREEFERRYAAMPHVTKAELIEGVVYVPSPVRHRQHGQPHIALAGWLVQYQASTPGVEARDNSTASVGDPHHRYAAVNIWILAGCLPESPWHADAPGHSAPAAVRREYQSRPARTSALDVSGSLDNAL